MYFVCLPACMYICMYVDIQHIYTAAASCTFLLACIIHVRVYVDSDVYTATVL